MRIDTLQVELRPRSAWEAMELGSALVRRHAGAIWRPWLLVTGAALVLLNLAAWAVGHVWLALLAMWWLRPVFDRIPLYVLSRAVFGATPGTAETLRAQLRWGWRPMRGHLTWRRLSPLRAAMLPIDLLEGADRARLGERRRVIGGGIGGHAALLAIACWQFIAALMLSAVMLVVLAVPVEMLPEAARAAWAMVGEALPPWALLVVNLVEWLAVAFIEPFYVGAGFGLYLNRRTQLEAWDLEIAFRRMRRRLDALATAVVLALAFALLLPVAGPAHAAAPHTPAEAAGLGESKTEANRKPGDAPAAGKSDKPADPAANRVREAKAAPPATGADAPAADVDTDDNDDDHGVAAGGDNAVPTRLDAIFGRDTVDHARFGKAVDKAYDDPLLRPTYKQTTWQRKDRDKKKPETPPKMPQLAWLSALLGFIAEYGLWMVVAALVLALALTARRWWPWLHGVTARPLPDAAPVDSTHLAQAEPLPPDIAAAARRLWAQGQPRRALALLYRASVAAMTARIDAHPPPGATEAECLRLARRLPEAEDRDAFGRVVRMWQYAAYGQRLPAADDFEALLTTLSGRFGWAS